LSPPIYREITESDFPFLRMSDPKTGEIEVD